MSSAIDLTLVAKGVPIDASLTLTGSAQKLVSKNTIQRYIEIFNVGSASVGLSFTTTTPVIGQANTITIPAGGEWVSPIGFIPQADFYVIGTNGQPVTCWYY